MKATGMVVRMAIRADVSVLVSYVGNGNGVLLPLVGFSIIELLAFRDAKEGIYWCMFYRITN